MWALWAEVVVLCSRAPGPPSAQLPLPGGVCSWQLPLWASHSACGLCTRLPVLPWPHRAAWVCGNLVLHNGHRVWWMSAPVSGYLLPHSTPPQTQSWKTASILTGACQFWESGVGNSIEHLLSDVWASLGTMQRLRVTWWPKVETIRGTAQSQFWVSAGCSWVLRWLWKLEHHIISLWGLLRASYKHEHPRETGRSCIALYVQVSDVIQHHLHQSRKAVQVFE